jgi:DNA end-binding protein Ku
MRAMWSGALAFGLVNVPVKMYAATEDHAVRFHQVHLKDGGRIKMQRVCSECGEQVAYADIGKGYEDPSGQRVILRPGDLDDLPAGPAKEIEVLQFVPTEQVDPILFDKSYYLEPDARAAKPYVLLREALQTTERTAIVRVAIRQRTQLAALRVRDDVLLLQTMLWPDEVREPDFAFRTQEIQIRPQELQMAQSLIGNLSADFDPTEYSDSYREAILALIEAKLSGGEGVPVSPEGDITGGPGAVVDLMTALQASVERTARSGTGAPSPREQPARRPAGAGRRKQSAGAAKTGAQQTGAKQTGKRSKSA